MTAFNITREVYDNMINYVESSTGCTISNEDVPNYPSNSIRPFTHRNIDVVTLGRYFAVMEEEHIDRFDGRVLEASFNPEMQRQYRVCKTFLTQKTAEAANHQDGVKGLVFSTADWEFLDMTYHYLSNAYIELQIDEEYLEHQAVDALEAQAAINTTIDESEREELEKDRDTAEQMLIILILHIIETPVIEYAVTDDGLDKGVDGADGEVDEAEEAPFGLLKTAAIALDTLSYQPGMASYETHASDRLKGISKAVHYLENCLTECAASDA